MAADDTAHHQHPGDVEGGFEPTLGSAPSRRPPPSAVSRLSTARPTTSRSVVMSRLQVERIDTVEGGGLSVLGLSLNSHCGVGLIVFSAFFLLIGLILAVIAFSNQVRADLGDDPNRLGFLQRNRLTLRVVAPVLIVAGFVMALLGVCFCALNYKMRQEEKEKEDLEYHCPLHENGHHHHHGGSGHYSHRSRNSVSSALPLGVAADHFNTMSSRNSFQASGGCDLCYERAKTAKSIQEYEATETYLNTMGRDAVKGSDIACFPRPLTPNNTNGDLFSLPGAANTNANGDLLPDNNNDESLQTANVAASPTATISNGSITNPTNDNNQTPASP